jgi:hypothetical protein
MISKVFQRAVIWQFVTQGFNFVSCGIHYNHQEILFAYCPHKLARAASDSTLATAPSFALGIISPSLPMVSIS